VYSVYLLRSLSSPDETYVGRTRDLRRRLSEHDSGDSIHTAKFRPWRLEAVVVFRDAGRAEAFETYLRSCSGRAFARRHLW
jgi:predicted GIY-YIG superfamily endonuclease